MNRAEHSRRVRHLALVSVVVAVAAWVIHVGVPSSLAPRVSVRWAERIQDQQRRDAERELSLVEGESIDGRTWVYDLADPSRAGVDALVTHPLVEDTHHIDRAKREVSAEAPAGRTRVRGGLSLLHDSNLLGWVGGYALAVFLVSVAWLATSGRALPLHETAGATREQRQTGNDPS